MVGEATIRLKPGDHAPCHDETAELLRRLWVDYRSGRIEGDPRAVVVVLLAGEHTQVAWTGRTTEADLELAAKVIEEGRTAMAEGRDIQEAVREMLRVNAG